MTEHRGKFVLDFAGDKRLASVFCCANDLSE
jgi:hypothetical protein